MKRRSFATTIITLFLVFNTLSIILFTYYVVEQEARTSLSYAKKSMLEIVREKSELISIKFEGLQSSLKVLKVIAEDELKNDNQKYISSEYIIDNKLVTRKKNEILNKRNQSNVLAKWEGKDFSVLERELCVTETIDGAMGSVLENKDILWGYTVTKNNFLRVSPYESLDEYFDNNHDQTKELFYTMAMPENNPNRESVITPPYNDYLGKGWTVTCTQPIYDKDDSMFGTICLDVSLQAMSEELFNDFSLGSNGHIIWLDKDGTIYYHNSFEKSSKIQGEQLNKNVYTLEDTNETERSIFRKALGGDYGIETYKSSKGHNNILVYSKIKNMDSYLVIQIDSDEITPTTKLDGGRILILIFIEFFIGLIFAIVLYNRFSKPMNSLVSRAKAISEGNYSVIEDMDYHNYNEIFQLNEAFSHMSKNITLNILAEKELQQTEKMAGIGQLAAAIVHELKNILARIKGATYIMRVTDVEKNTEEITTIDMAVKEAEDVITTLLDFSKKKKSGQISITSIINQILLLSNKDIISANIKVILDMQDMDVNLAGGIEALKIILQNIILNAIQSTGEDGHIWITVKIFSDFARIKIKDDGPGIKIEPKEKIFEPFVSTKENGSGIGLWITKKMIKSLNGDIKLVDKGNSTEFIIDIPIESDDNDE